MASNRKVKVIHFVPTNKNKHLLYILSRTIFHRNYSIIFSLSVYLKYNCFAYLETEIYEMIGELKFTTLLLVLNLIQVWTDWVTEQHEYALI